MAPSVEGASAGLGLKGASLWGFGGTVWPSVLFALIARDRLLGEPQAMLGAFFGFFIVLALLIAWIF